MKAVLNCHFIRSLSLTVNYVHEAWHRGLQDFFPSRERMCQLKTMRRHTRTDNPHTKWRSTPTLPWEWLLKDAFVKTAERSAEVLKVRKAELLVPQLGDRQTILRRRGRRGRRWWVLGRLSLWVATHLQDIRRGRKNTDKLWEAQNRREEGCLN